MSSHPQINCDLEASLFRIHAQFSEPIVFHATPRFPIRPLLTLMTVDHLLSQIRPGSTPAPVATPSRWQLASQMSSGDEFAPLYQNVNTALGIDFRVQRLPLVGLQVMDPRLVRIAPGATNECHRHAHESLFVVLGGQGELRLGSERVPLTVGDVTCVPRWVVHQTHNTSSDHDLLLLAITDFGLTSAVLGDDDQSMRLK
jgi:quercetin dioxygenase-like cupin family protein